MENLYDYCENILIDIKKSRGYIESGEYLNGNIVINIIKTSLLKKVNKKLESIDNYIKKINDDPKVLDSGYELKSFINNGHATVVYENDQMNTVVYKQLNELYQYLEDLESKVNELKSNIKKKGISIIRYTIKIDY